MSNYTAEFEPFYANGWENQPSENTPIMGEALDEYDYTLVKIEEFLSNLDLSVFGADYALLTEAGYSLNLSVDKNYVLTIDLLNKAGTVLSSKNVDLPLETMFINAAYANGVITLTLQNGNTLDVEISNIVIGIVPTSRKIAGIDLEDDVTKEELQNALEIYDSTVMGGKLKPWLNSYEEIEAGIWIDGKPLYQTVINFSVPETSGNFITNQIDISNLNADTIIVSHASFSHKDGDYLRWYVIPYITNSGEQVKITTSQKDNDYLLVISNSATFSNDTGYAILNYTKTTDAEGSGNNLNPYGIYDAKLDEVKADIEELQSNVSDLQSAKDITTTDSTTLSNSNSGRVKFNKIVGGIEQANTSGKNLLDCSGLTESTVNGVTFTPVYSTTEEHVKAGYPLGSLMYINVNGTASEEATIIVGEITLSSAVEAIYSGCPSGGTLTTFNSALKKDSTSWLDNDYGSGATVSLEEGSIYQYVIAIRVDYTATNLKFYPMVRLATETDATYEPYTNGASPNPSYPQPIYGSEISEIRTHGVNFLNPATAIDNKFLNTPAYNYNITDNAEHWVSDFIPVKEGQVISTNYAPIATAIYDANRKGFRYHYNREQVITIPSGGKYVVFCYQKEIVEFGGDVMICEGRNPTYEPYTESTITLSNPITLYGDEMAEDVERKYKKVVFDGSDDEEWVASPNLSGRYNINIPDTKGATLPICSHAKSVAGTMTVNQCYINSSLTFYINTDVTIFATVDNWKAHLSSNPMTVIYELAEPTTEELPTEDKIALNSLSTFDGVTYVEFVDCGVTPTVSLDYGTSKVGGMTLEGLLAGINGELQSQANSDRITALESAVVNNV